MIQIKEITDFLDAEKIPYSYYGDELLIIKNTVSIEKINHHLISWIKNNDYMKSIVGKDIKNSLIVCQKFDVNSFKSGNFIFCDKPKEVFFTILNHFFQPETNNEYISQNSVVETTNIGNNDYIEHNCYIESDVIISDHVTIKNNVKIYNLCHISHNDMTEKNVSIVGHSMIGGSVLLKKNYYIAPSASVMNQISIGENSLIGLGAVVLKDEEDHLVVPGVPGKIIKRLEVGE